MSMNAWEAAAQQLWDESADDWHRRSAKMWHGGSREAIMPLIEKQEQRGYWLDAGCGDGYGSKLLANIVDDVMAIDFSQRMVEIASQYVTAQQADLMKLPFEHETFDGAMVINCFEWVNDPLVALTEINRVLKPGGLLVASILGPTAAPRENSLPRFFDKLAVCNTMMPWEFKRLAEHVGFELVEEQGIWKQQGRELVPQLPPLLQQAACFSWLMVWKAS